MSSFAAYRFFLKSLKFSVDLFCHFLISVYWWIRRWIFFIFYKHFCSWLYWFLFGSFLSFFILFAFFALISFWNWRLVVHICFDFRLSLKVFLFSFHELMFPCVIFTHWCTFVSASQILRWTSFLNYLFGISNIYRIEFIRLKLLLLFVVANYFRSRFFSFHKLS